MDVVTTAQRLVGIDSVTAASNATVSEHYVELLQELHFELESFPYVDAHGTDKICLAGRRQPQRSGRRPDSGGIGFFCHNDVVSVDGWNSPHGGPWAATLAEERLWGRGACDMKGPTAAALAAIARIDPAEQTAPIYFFVTGDEECGMLGAKLLTQQSNYYTELVDQAGVGIIGEPTSLQVVNAHKGGCHVDITSTGVAVNSSTAEGRNANWQMIPLLTFLEQLHQRCETEPQFRNEAFSPPTYTMNLVIENRPSSSNITVGQTICRIFFRPMPDTNWQTVLEEIKREAKAQGLEVKSLEPLRPLCTPLESPLVQTALRLLHQPQPQAVSYATDGCCFEQFAELIVLGPGNIAQRTAQTSGSSWNNCCEGSTSITVCSNTMPQPPVRRDTTLVDSRRERFNKLTNLQQSPHPLPIGYSVRAAVDSDLSAVLGLLRPFVEQRKVLRRTRAETTALMTTGFVAEFEGEVVGFSAVEIYSKKLSEIQCLTVCESHQGRGIGGALVKHCVDLARQRGVMEVMAISSSEKFLHDLGFDYALPDQKRALFYQLRSREEVYRELEQLGE